MKATRFLILAMSAALAPALGATAATAASKAGQTCASSAKDASPWSADDEFICLGENGRWTWRIVPHGRQPACERACQTVDLPAPFAGLQAICFPGLGSILLDRSAGFDWSFVGERIGPKRNWAIEKHGEQCVLQGY